MLNLSTFSPQGDVTEFAPLLEICSNLTILGLGEPTHGTREAFQLKHRMIRALAEGGLLRTVAFECGLANGRMIDEYIRGGTSTAEDAVIGQDYWCWSTTEIAALVEWLRLFNSRLPADERIAFYGIDVQRCEPAIPELSRLLEQSQPTMPAKLALHQRISAGLTSLRDGELEAGSAAARLLAEDLFEVAGQLPDFWPRMLCLNLSRHIDCYLGSPEMFLARRDEYMAATLREVTSGRPGLTALWAHNEHVASNPDYFGSPSMGYWLRRDYGASYMSLGMLFGSGSFRARGIRGAPVQIHEVPTAPSGFVEDELNGRPAQLLDVSSCGANRLRRYVGDRYDAAAAVQMPELFSLDRPPSDFDLLAWIPESTPARPILRGDR